MLIKFFQRLLKPADLSETPSKTPQQAAPQQTKAGIAQVRDGFETSRPDFFSGKFLDGKDLQQEQQYQKNGEDNILVDFQQAEARSPYVVGGLWNGSDKPPETKEEDEKD